MTLKTIIQQMAKNGGTQIANFVQNNAKQIGIGMGATILGAGVLDYTVTEGSAQVRGNRYAKIQERKQKERDAYDRARYYSNAQMMHEQKTGHTNTWGGLRY